MKRANPHDSPAWRLFHNTYHIRMPALAQYSMDYMSDAIVNITGDKKIDKANLNMMIDSRRTAAGMAMLMAEGYGLELITRWDSVRIYTDIIQHFQGWLQEAHTGVPAECFPPIEDFRTLEMLAMEMHDNAMTMKPEEVRAASSIFDQLRSLNRARNSVVAERMERLRVTSGGQVKAYRSIVDEIEKYVIGD